MPDSLTIQREELLVLIKGVAIEVGVYIVGLAVDAGFWKTTAPKSGPQLRKQANNGEAATNSNSKGNKSTYASKIHHVTQDIVDMELARRYV